ncbi:hypothetical protein NDU88_004495 [Pleurodeles waltl]|uniref:Uncharacterized protein n=1 Tax=Pleurodeles waltl TaxID=8319 RepID=A0AAV7W966_PLEWA|nr:hypothetical protein NDU88_004495 [Pleurodeles waltl]
MSIFLTSCDSMAILTDILDPDLLDFKRWWVEHSVNNVNVVLCGAGAVVDVEGEEWYLPCPRRHCHHANQQRAHQCRVGSLTSKNSDRDGLDQFKMVSPAIRQQLVNSLVEKIFGGPE